MSEKKGIDQIRAKKTYTMLDSARQEPITNKEPIMLTDGNFSATVKANELMVVDFWAPWCGPCRMVGPLIEQLATEYAGRVLFGKINVDENQLIPSQFGVQSIPTLIVFKKGEQVETLVGYCSKSVIESKFKSYMEKNL